MQLRSIARTRRVWTTLALCLGLAASTTSAAAQGARYAEAKANAAARAFEDPRGSLVATLADGTLLQVHGRSEGTYPFLEVEVAGSFPVWVFGKYLTEDPAEGVLRISGTRVNMRPAPNSGRESMALPTRLDAGTRVEFVKRDDPAKPMAEDWVQVWAPAGTRVWVLESETRPASDAAQAAAAFRAAGRSLPSAPRTGAASGAGEGSARQANPSAGGTTNGAAGSGAASSARVSQGARDALARADQQYGELKGRANNTSAEWLAVQGLYEEAMRQSPASSTVHALAERGVERTTAHLELLAIKADLSQEADARREHLERLVDEERQIRLAKTTNWGRFDSRGWLEKQTSPGQPERWFLRWSGERTTEVVCSQGRYDLNLFEGYQVGVQGMLRSEYVAATLESDEQLRLLDLSKMEIISGGGRGGR